MAEPFRNRERQTSCREHKRWFKGSPYKEDQDVLISGPSVGRPVRSCPVNSSGETIFYGEWRHGDL